MKTTALMCGVIACLSSAASAADNSTVGPTAVPKSVSSPVAAGAAIGAPVPPFTAELTRVNGGTVQTSKFDSHQTKGITAYIFVGSTCPATNAYADRFKALEQTYGPKGVAFVYLYPNGNDTHEVQLGFHKEKGFAGPLIDDHGAHLAQLFQAKRTTEIFVADQKGIVVYHGAVDDSRDPNAVKQHYLSTALDQLLAGQPIATSATDVFA